MVSRWYSIRLAQESIPGDWDRFIRLFGKILQLPFLIWTGIERGFHIFESANLTDMDVISTNPNRFISSLLPAAPQYGYLIAAAVLFVWLVGIICGWEWTYSRPGSYRGNFLLNLLGPKTDRILL